MTRARHLATGLLALAALSAAGRVEAIPAFARKFGVSCTQCHGPFPRLKAFGEEFAAAGFRSAMLAPVPAHEPESYGDPLLKLPREVPLSIRMEGFASWKQGDVARTDVETPWLLKVISGGSLTDRVSYFVYFLTEQGESFGVEDFWARFDSIFHGPVDLQVGQFQVCDPMFERELRLERSDYEILTARVGRAGVDLTYDRGLVATWHAPARLTVVLEVVNGSGIGPADGLGRFDKDNYKNFALRLARPFGRARVGLFGYTGRERGDDGATDAITYFGPDLVLDLGDRWAFSLEALERRDTDPFFTGVPSGDLVTRGGFAELHFFPRGQDGRWVVSALYNDVRSDDPAARAESASLTVNYLVARNLRLTAEAARDLEHHTGRGSVGIVTAF